MNRENQVLVTDEPVEFENYTIQGQDFRKIITDHFRGVCGIYLNLIKKIEIYQHVLGFGSTRILTD